MGFINAPIECIDQKLRNNNNNIYFRININNKHWIGCKLSKEKNGQRNITIFDSSNNKTKDNKIAKKLIESIDVPHTNFNDEIEVKQIIKNHNNNCAFESEVSMLIDANVINNENTGYIDSKKYLDMNKITNDINDLETLVKMKYGGNGKQNNKDKNLLLLVIDNKDNIRSFIIKDNKNNDIEVTKIGTKYYVISENKEACELKLKKGEYTKEKTFKCDQEVFDYIWNNYNIGRNKTISNKIIIDSKEIDKNNFKNSLDDNKIGKARFEGNNFDILKVENNGNFVICDNNKIYRLKNCEGIYKVDKNMYFDYFENDLLNKVERVKEKDLDSIAISSGNVESNCYYDLNYEFLTENQEISKQYDAESFKKAYNDFFKQNNNQLKSSNSEDFQIDREKDINDIFIKKEKSDKEEPIKIENFVKLDKEQQKQYNEESFKKAFDDFQLKFNSNELTSMYTPQIDRKKDINNIFIKKEKSDKEKPIKIENFLKLDKEQQKQYIIETKVKYIDIIQKIAEGENIELDEDSQKIIINYIKKNPKETRVAKYLLNNEYVKKAFSQTLNNNNLGI